MLITANLNISYFSDPVETYVNLVVLICKS